MRQKLTSLLLMLMVSSAMFAQAPSIQVVHNAADPAAATVDVYVAGILALDDFAFRTATPFIDNIPGIGAIPAGVPIAVAVAPSTSTSVADAFYTGQLPALMMNTSYIVVANGVADSTQFSTAANTAAAISFDVFPYVGAQETGTAGQLDILVYHGATDAPAVNVVARSEGIANVLGLPGGAELITNLSYGEFNTGGYIPVPDTAGIVGVDVVLNSSGAKVATYIVDVPALSGNSALVIASGFVDPAANQNGEAFGLFAVLPTGGPFVPLATAGNARIQFVHNSPDAAIASFDTYVNGVTKGDDFAYRTALPYIDVETGFDTYITVNAATSTDVDDDFLGAIGFQAGFFEDGETYQIFASGFAGPTTVTNPDGFDVDLSFFGTTQARETGSGMMGTFDFSVHHGAPDAPFVDIEVANTPIIVDNASYGVQTNYVTAASANYVINVWDSARTTVLFSYYAGLSTTAFAPVPPTATIYASGLLGDGSFGLWVVLADGTTFPLPLLGGTANVQVIHNSADSGAATVDIYVMDGTGQQIAKLDDVTFRSATPFLALPSNIAIDVVIAAPTSTGPTDQVVATIPVKDPAQGMFGSGLATNQNYVLIADGVLDTTAFTANPDGNSIAFGLRPFIGAATSAPTGTTNVLLYHGATDIPAISAIGQSSGATLAAGLSYGNYNAPGYLPIPGILGPDALVDIRLTGDSSLVNTWVVPLQDLDAQAVVVFASGFLDGAQGNDFGIYVADTAGNVTALSIFVGVDEIASLDAISMYPNPANNNIRLDLTLNEVVDVQVAILNTVGQVIMTANDGNINAGRNYMDFNVSNLDAGMYLMNVIIDGKSTSQTFIVQ